MLSQNELQGILYESLIELGLTENERHLYVLSLSLGPVTITKLAEHLGMSRPNVYKVIEALEKRGLAKFANRKHHVRTFVVEPPTAVTDALREKKSAIAQLDEQVMGAMPNLLAMYGQGELPTAIKVVQGREGFLKLFHQILDEESHCVDFCGSVEDYLGFIPQADQERWTERRLKKNIRVRTLGLPGPALDRVSMIAKTQLREVKYLKTNKLFQTSFQLFGNKIIFWQPKAPLAVVVEDEFLVAMMRSLFLKLWEAA
jgi:sugar-specific transcriptional regulator TrmB